MWNASKPVKWIRKNWTQGLNNYDSNNIVIVSPDTSLESLCFVVNGNTITNYNAWFEECSSDVVIPSEISGVQITSIWSNAFYNKWITSIIIPDTVTSIWSYAFEYNNIEEVEIPWTVWIISDYVFAYNNIKNVTIWSWVKTINTYAFAYNSLEEVEIPWSVTSIWSYAFYNNNLGEVEISWSVTSIWSYAFAYNNIEEVEIPWSVTSIWSRAFYSNAKNPVIWFRTWWTIWLSNSDSYLRIIDKNNKCFVVSNGQITNYNEWFEECPSDVVIPTEINGVQITSIW
jgi:hypothetical protein